MIRVLVFPYYMVTSAFQLVLLASMPQATPAQPVFLHVRHVSQFLLRPVTVVFLATFSLTLRVYSVVPQVTTLTT